MIGRGDAAHHDRAEELEREAAEQHLEPEQRAADGHVVGRGDAGGRAAGDEQPRLAARDVEPIGEPRAGRGPGLQERALAAERRAGADRDDGDHPAEQGAPELEPALVTQMASMMPAVPWPPRRRFTTRPAA